MRRWRFRTQVLGVTGLLLGVLTAGSLTAVYYYLGQQVWRQSERKLLSASRVLTSIFDRTREQLLERATILAQLPSLRDALTADPDQLGPLLQEVQAIRAANMLWATDAQGRVTASTAEYPPLGADQRDHRLIARALTGAQAMGIDRYLDDWWMVLTLPVHPSDTSEAVIGTVSLALLVGQAYLNRVGELVETDVAFRLGPAGLWSAHWPPETRARVLGDLAAVPAATARETVLPNRSRYLWMTQTLPVGLYPQMDPLPVLFGSRMDQTVLHQTARAIEWIALAILALGALVIWQAVGSISRPLSRLVADARRIGGGDWRHRTQPAGSRELVELATAFNQMVENLEQSRSALLEEQRFSVNVMRRITNCLIVTDADGIIRQVNPATTELLGFGEAYLRGRHLVTLFAEGTLPLVGDRWKAFLQQGILRDVEAVFRSKDQAHIPVLFSAAVLRGAGGELEGMVCVAQDITERKRLERMKDEFISTVSHELRTPVTTIRESMALIEDGTLGTIAEEQRKFLRIGLHETRRLERLITTVMDLSLLESGGMRLAHERLDLPALIETAWRAQTGVEDRQCARRTTGPLPVVRGDPVRIQQVLEHLFANAIQFTKETGRITVAAMAHDGGVAVSVQDDGVGIAPAELRRLFEKFVQPGRAEEERSGGLGIGLALCKRIIELHGGTIRVDSTLGGGTTITFALPGEGRGPLSAAAA